MRTHQYVTAETLTNWPRQDDSKILWMATRHGHADASVAMFGERNVPAEALGDVTAVAFRIADRIVSEKKNE